MTRGRAGKRPVDGYYVTLWRLMLRYPELLAWEMLWTDSLRETYAAMYAKVKSIKPSSASAGTSGTTIRSTRSIAPSRISRELSKYSDFLKMVMYHNCGGERMASYIDSVGKTIYGDVPQQELLDFHYRVLDYKRGEAARRDPRSRPLARLCLPRSQARAGGAERDEDATLARHRYRHSRPRATQQQIHARRARAMRCWRPSARGADGVLLSRKYSEMKLANLRGAGAAIRSFAG